MEGGPLISNYLGLFLLGTAFISIGVFASSLTENQIVAAVITFGILLVLWIIGFYSGYVQTETAEVLRYLSITEHMDNFSRGIVDTKDVVYTLSFSFFALFLTIRVLESKKWRG